MFRLLACWIGATYLCAANGNTDADLGPKRKRISPSVKNLLLQYSWPGNVREVQHTLTKTEVWSSAEILGLPSYQTLTNWLKKYGLE